MHATRRATTRGANKRAAGQPTRDNLLNGARSRLQRTHAPVLRHMTKGDQIAQSYRRSDALHVRRWRSWAGTAMERAKALLHSLQNAKSTLLLMRQRNVGTIRVRTAKPVNGIFFSPKSGAAALQKKTAPLPGVSLPVPTATTEVKVTRGKTCHPGQEKQAGEPAAQVNTKRLLSKGSLRQSQCLCHP